MLLAGSRKVVPALAMPSKAVRYCSGNAHAGRLIATPIRPAPPQMLISNSISSRKISNSGVR